MSRSFSIGTNTISSSNDDYRLICPHCHTAEYVREDIDGHHCAVCGTVVSEDVYRNDQSFDPTTHRVQGTFIRSVGGHGRTARHVAAETRIRNLAERLRLDKSYESEMIRYMNALLANESTERIWNQGRYGDMVIGVLAFIVCRCKGVAVTFQDICDGLSTREKINEFELSRVYYRVATVLNTDTPRLITPSSWVKKAIFRLYSEGACVDDHSNSDSDSTFDDSDDDSDITAINAVLRRGDSRSLSSVPQKPGLGNSANGKHRKLQLRTEEKAQLTTMATRVLNIATKHWITTGKKPMPVVAASIVLAIEYYHDTDDVMNEVSELLGAAKTTVNKRCSEILRSFSTSLKTMGFTSVRNRKDILKHIPLALMYFDVVDAEEGKHTASSQPPQPQLTPSSTEEIMAATKASEASRRMLPASFLKNERIRQERSALIERCKQLNQAVLDGTPFPEDFCITEEMMLVGKLLFEGVSEELIMNCQLDTLKSLEGSGASPDFFTLGNASEPSQSPTMLTTPRRRILKRYEKNRTTPKCALNDSASTPTVKTEKRALSKAKERHNKGDDNDNEEEEIEDFHWDPEVANCLREAQDRKLVGKVVEVRERLAEAARMKSREVEHGAGEGAESGQPKKKAAKVDKKASTKINRERLTEFLSNERQRALEDSVMDTMFCEASLFFDDSLEDRKATKGKASKDNEDFTPTPTQPPPPPLPQTQQQLSQPLPITMTALAAKDTTVPSQPRSETQTQAQAQAQKAHTQIVSPTPQPTSHSTELVAAVTTAATSEAGGADGCTDDSYDNGYDEYTSNEYVMDEDLDIHF